MAARKDALWLAKPGCPTARLRPAQSSAKP